MMSSFFTDYKDRKPYELKGGDLEFRVAVIDDKFDNNDNPYGEFKLHRYTTIKNITNILGEDPSAVTDEIIELKECEYDDETSPWFLS